MSNKFRRINNSTFAGVCSGIAYGLEVPAWIVKAAWLLCVLIGGTGLLAYIVCALLMPKWKEDPADFDEICN